LGVEEELRGETLKWLERIEDKIIALDGDRGFIENVKAYVSDSKYFLQKNDLVRAFECVVWAWAWLEIGLEIGKLRIR